MKVILKPDPYVIERTVILRFKLTNLEIRRDIGDLIETLKILTGRDLTPEQFFEATKSSSTRRHGHKCTGRQRVL